MSDNLSSCNSSEPEKFFITFVAAERMTVVLSVVRQVGGGFVHCIVRVFWEVWPHAMPVIVVERVNRVGAARRTMNGYPKSHVGQML